MPPNKDAPGCFACPPGLICLPPISEDLQLIWTQAAQTSELDGNQHLLQTFSYFPYPSLSDLALLCLRHGLHMEKVKAWFMAQRLRCGISWSAEEIEETRARLIYHQDQLHFSCLLDGSNGDSCPQSCKSQEYHQPAPPAPLHHPVKYENQQCDVTSSSRFSTAQEIRELGRISEDVWEQKGNGLYHPSKAQENCQSAFHHSTKETLSGAFLPATATGLDYKFQNSHTAAWGLTKTSLQPSEPVAASAVNGKHHSAVPPARCSVRASPSSSAAASAESCSLQNYQSPACDQQPASGCCSEILRKPRRKTKEQLDMLKSFFLHCQWAKREDYHYLEQVTGLPRAEIIQWFGDTRYALKHGQLKWFRDNAGQSFDPALSLPSYPYHPSHPDTKPLQRYWESHPPLQDNSSPLPCRESDRSRSPAPYEVEVCLSEEEEEDEEMKAALLKEEDEDYEEEEDNEEDDDNDEDWTM